MKNQILWLFFLLMLVTSVITAQNNIINGKVVDGDFPLPGATVALSENKIGTITDFDGNFILSNISSGNYNLVISYIGYESYTTQVSIKEGETIALGNLSLKPSSTSLEEVVLQSSPRRLSEAKALNIQKNSLKIMNVIAADGIGKLPDRNAAEAVQRIPGVSIERDQSEGRFVAVRGLPSEWNSTTINGNRIPTAEEETSSRAVAFDFFPTEMIGYVQVAKALTPDQEGDAIGGSVNFITKTAPTKFTLDGTLAMGYNEKSDKGVYSGSVTFGDKSKSGKTGFLINFSQWNRNWATDNFEARRKGDEGVFRLELRDYTGERQTTGLNGAFEFNPSEKDRLYIKGNYGTLSDTELHYKHRVRFDKYKGFDDATNRTGRVELQNIYNELITEFIGVELGGKHTSSKGNLDWSVTSYRNEFKYGNIPNQKDKSYFLIKFKQDGIGFNPSYLEDRGNGPRVYWNSDGGTLNASDPNNLFGFFTDPNFQVDPSQLSFSDLELYKISIVERDNIVASLNYEYDVNTDFSLKVGGKFRDKDRRAIFSDEFYGWNGSGAAPVLGDLTSQTIEQPGRTEFLSELDTNIGNSFSSQVLSPEGMVSFYNTHFDNNLTLLEGDSEIVANGGGLGRNFDVDETHASGYAMGTYKISDQVTVLGGVRATNTNTVVNGYRFDITEQNPDGVLSEVEEKKNYWSILPMFHLKYTPNDRTNVRFAATRTFTRPDFGHLAPGGTFLEFDNEYKGGNSQVDPTYAINLDVLGEYYFDNVGIISGGVFYKSITDPIFKSTNQGEINGISGVEISIPRNGDNAWLLGAEIGGNKKFDFLPGFLSGFGVQANYTYTKSEFTIPGRDEKTRLPRQADHLINAQLYYEKAGFNIRAAYNFKGEYITDYGSTGLDRDDIYYGDYSTLDANASFKINKHFTIFAEVNNLLNESLEYYYGDKTRPKQVEYYGVRGQAGIRWSL
ncbi:TonB-dependent receptor [Aquimarina sp. 2201CG1-2-11]|uniref:TonB-dependent receptor n=1 Tax=Aquimarina discodermiae TaxID=3231043 RepID=UPI003461891C